jgi:hypothetical protein
MRCVAAGELDEGKVRFLVMGVRIWAGRPRPPSCIFHYSTNMHRNQGLVGILGLGRGGAKKKREASKRFSCFWQEQLRCE